MIVEAKPPTFWERLKHAFAGDIPPGHVQIIAAINAAHEEVIAQGERLRAAVGESEQRLRTEVDNTNSSVALLVKAMRAPKTPAPRTRSARKVKDGRNRTTRGT